MYKMNCELKVDTYFFCEKLKINIADRFKFHRQVDLPFIPTKGMILDGLHEYYHIEVGSVIYDCKDKEFLITFSRISEDDANDKHELISTMKKNGWVYNEN